jgi:hypothetical protein
MLSTCKHIQGTNWRNTSVLDFVAHVLGAQSTLTEEEQEDLRTILKLDGVTCLTKNKADTIATALKCSALWNGRPSKLTAEAISWLQAKQMELEAGIGEEEMEATVPFELHFKNYISPNERGQLALTVQQHSIEDIFTKARSGRIVPCVRQFAKCAAEYAARAGRDCEALLGVVWALQTGFFQRRSHMRSTHSLCTSWYAVITYSNEFTPTL